MCPPLTGKTRLRYSPVERGRSYRSSRPLFVQPFTAQGFMRQGDAAIRPGLDDQPLPFIPRLDHPGHGDESFPQGIEGQDLWGNPSLSASSLRAVSSSGGSVITILISPRMTVHVARMMKLNYTRKWHAKGRSARTPDGYTILDGPAKTVPWNRVKCPRNCGSSRSKQARWRLRRLRQ